MRIQALDVGVGFVAIRHETTRLEQILFNDMIRSWTCEA